MNEGLTTPKMVKNHACFGFLMASIVKKVK